MKLKTLEISGFKSFAERTKIDFMPGITGVVGPNGSGKSNIIESIRWVMGETSAKGLRGDKMADVIFGGTATRSPLNRAEVSITFDNEDHYLNSEYAEIRITRTLYRNGDSKYQINGTTVRLKDIHELFMDSGLGRESFSIISQGRVESIFSAKPEDRRAIIEDVAGVYKYKQNKDRAEKELAGTHENLQRVQDILYELEGRVEPLAEQSARAQDYLTQKEAFDKLDRARLILELTDWSREQAEVSEAKRESEEANQSLSNGVDTLSENLSELKQERTASELARQAEQDKLLALTTRVEKLLGEQNLQAERTANRSAATEDLRNQIDSFEARVAELKKTQESRLRKVTKSESEVSDLAAAIIEAEAEHPNQQLTAVASDLEATRDELVEAMQALTNAQNEQKYLAKENEQQDATSARLEQRVATVNAQFEQAQQKYDEAQARTAEIVSDNETAQAELTRQQTAGKDLEQKHQDKRQVWFNLLEQQQRLSTRLDSMKRVSENYDGYYNGVKQLMNARDQFPGIHGVVAELVTVPTDYQLAIETALGGALQQVVVDAENTAKSAIRYLSQHRMGRVTFLPLTTVRGRNLQPQQVNDAQNMTGFIGVAANLVKSSQQYSGIVSSLLGTTIIVDDIDHAIAMGRALQHRVRLVTLDGQIMNAGGSMTGGANRTQGNGLLSQQTEVETLTKQVGQMTKQVEAAEAEVKTLAANLQQATETFRAQQTTTMAANEAAQQATAELQVFADRLAMAKREREALQYELRQTSDGSADQESAIAENVLAVESAQSIVNRLQAQMTELTDAQTELRVQVVDADKELTDLRAQKAAAEATILADRERLTDAESQLQAEQERLAEVQQQLDDVIANPEDAQAHIAAELEKAQAAKVAAETLSAELARKLADLRERINQSETRLMDAQEQQRNAMTKLNNLSARQAELRTKILQHEENLAEQYGLSYEDGEAILAENDLPIDDIRSQLKLLKQGLAEIGHVNVDAITEYQEVKERYDFLHQQQEDLLMARDNLRQTMDEMDEEVQTRFKETFDAIAGHFSEIYVKMFGGGQAELQLTDPEHLLTTGVDIKAQPPGKKFQQMSLLSGGEKALTAISLLFAILEVRPVPFAVLDETEAALDEANVDRFARYLHEVNERTQFIVITHRKGTMTSADVLYGVTMQEPGVSTMVSVKLAELDEALVN
jgi:chromosome segregation protein